MKRPVSRRDFLKVAGVGLGALAFKPFNYEALYQPKRLPQFPASEIIGRMTGLTDIRSKPSSNDLVGVPVGKLYDDNLIEWHREVVGEAIGLTNQKYLEVPGGYVWSSRVQPTKNLPNTPITEVPAGKPGFWVEVTVPYVDLTLEGAPASPWIQSLIQYQFPPRVYYGQVIWIDQVRQSNGFVEYRWNESPGHGYGFGDIYWLDGAGVKVLTEEEIAPISPNIDPAEKKIVANLTYQTLSCFEGNNEVFFCRISSGAIFDYQGNPTDSYSTPVGDLNTHWKIISLNMSGGGSAAGYSTPAVPWDTVISGEGIAIHGAFWHNDFGERRSHGCINVTPEDAKWIFRWTTPYISLAQCEQRMTWPDHGTVVTVNELKA
ncbi:MAG: L,D-transpeptidase [Anaerolineales bacterium]|nr:L,D-transpeptidase [Anaerolineales bacterium]MCZ2122317.1 L,D-transpeptidase [Anaerolineales bacterium]